jgi:hypothetical protein
VEQSFVVSQSEREIEVPGQHCGKVPHAPVASDHGRSTGVATATHRLSDAANEERNNIHKHRRTPTVRGFPLEKSAYKQLLPCGQP